MSTQAYKLRVDTPQDDSDVVKKVKKWVMQYSPHRLFFVREHVLADGAPTNHHLHGFILMDKSHKMPKIRASLKKIVFGNDKALSGNGHYSLSTLKPEEPAEHPYRQYENYLCKGTKDELPRLVRRLTTLATYTAEFLDSGHTDYWAMAGALKKRKVRMYDDCLDHCKRQRTERREDIARIVTDAYLLAEKPMNIPTMRGLVNLLYAKVCPDKETAMSVLIDMIMERRDIGR